jgi:hypothetical protein
VNQARVGCRVNQDEMDVPLMHTNHYGHTRAAGSTG